MTLRPTATQVEVVDLLVNFAKHVLRSNRWDVLLGIKAGPNADSKQALYPTVAGDNQRIVASPAAPNIEAVRTILSSFPSVRELVNSGELSHRLDGCHPNANALFQWIITSNRTFLVRLPVGNQIASLNCSHQFLMKSATPEKEAKFQALKRKHKKSVFAFHGSPTECWHSIVRCGLKNVSNTNMMTAGAAHGAGIYCAPDMGTSIGYMKSSVRGNPTRGAAADHSKVKEYLGEDMCCMAILEV